LAAYYTAIDALDFAAINCWPAEEVLYLAACTGDGLGRVGITPSFRAYFAADPHAIVGGHRFEALDACGRTSK